MNLKKTRKTQCKNVGIHFEVMVGIFLLCWTLLFRNRISGLDIAYAISFTLIFGRMLLGMLFKAFKRHRLLTSSESMLHGMSGVEFEDYCIEQFKKLGYSALPTPTTGDYGADIVLKRDGKKTVVQCKRYKGKVGVSAVQEAIGARGYYGADCAMVVTNSFFTPNAVKLARANAVVLWDRPALIKHFKLKK